MSRLAACVALLFAAGACNPKPQDPPPAPKASAMIGAEGGVLTLGAVAVTVPAGALAATTALSVEQLAPATPGAPPVFRFGPEGTVFAVPAEVTLPVPDGVTDPVVHWTAGAGFAAWRRSEFGSTVTHPDQALAQQEGAGDEPAFQVLEAAATSGAVTFQVRHLSEAFVAQRLDPSAELSSFTVSTTRALANGTDLVTATVTAISPDGLPIPDRWVRVAVLAGATMVQEVYGWTGADGAARFTLASTVPGVRTVAVESLWLNYWYGCADPQPIPEATCAWAEWVVGSSPFTVATVTFVDPGDECATGAATCDPHATCTDTPGSYTCACSPGWNGDGTTCADVDECADGTAGCSPLATCANLDGTFACTCDAGYYGDGFLCADQDECGLGTATCPAGSACVNDVGGYHCAVDAPPRPVAPVSTARATTRRPTLRWELPAGADGARVELCADRACTRPLATLDAAGSSAMPAADLPVGTVFWRLRSLLAGVPGAEVSPTWQLRVPPRSAPVSSAWGATVDVNGDGYDDLAVGAYSGSRVHVFFGSAAGVSTVPDQTLVSPLAPATNQFGLSCAPAGDMNGDGYADLAVGDPGANSAVYVYPGGPAGVDSIPMVTFEPVKGTGLPGYVGRYLAPVGDVDGDGYADLAVGAQSWTVAYVLRGAPGGMAPTPYVLDVGATTYSWLTVAGAGDVDGDGLADVAVGFPGASVVVASPPRTVKGKVGIFRGSLAGLPTVPDAWLSLDPTPSLAGTALPGNDFAGAMASGDMNGDGYADLAVGAPEVVAHIGSTGWVHVFPGGPGGLSPLPTLGSASDRFGVGGISNLGFGRRVVAGDSDGDGYTDLFIHESDGSVAPWLEWRVGGTPTGIELVWTTPALREDTRTLLLFAGGGDLDGDGMDEIALFSNGTGAVYAEQVLVFGGRAAGTAYDRAAPTAVIAQPTPGDGFGNSVALGWR